MQAPMHAKTLMSSSCGRRGWRWSAIVIALALAYAAAITHAQEAASDCRVDVEITRNPSLTLDVTYTCRTTDSMTFMPATTTAREFVRDVRDANGAELTMVASAWDAVARNGQARISYRVDLAALARTADAVPVAVARGDAVTAVLGTWLLQPRHGTVAVPLVIDIAARSSSADLLFVAGLPRVGEAWRLAGTTVYFAGYATIGAFALHVLPVSAPGSLAPGSAPAPAAAPLRLAILPGEFTLPAAELVGWVARTMEAEANFWDGFPAPGLLITLVPSPGQARVGYGRVVPGGGASMAIEVGTAVGRAALYDDWVLVHETIHTAMPFITGRTGWLMEGAATWLEPIVRARAGWKREDDVWREWIENMPRGAGAYEQGGPARGSIYWSGALFMLLADIEARRATDGRVGIEDCLRGQLRAGPQAALRLPREAWVQRCDAALGVPIVAPLVARLVDRGEPVDLPALWRSLGVSLQDGRIIYDDAAPLAAIRRLIVVGHPSRPQRRVPLPV
jgi:hypothetical protein